MTEKRLMKTAAVLGIMLVVSILLIKQTGRFKIADSTVIAEAQTSNRSRMIKLCREFVDFAGVNLVGGVNINEMASGQSRVYNFNKNSVRLKFINHYSKNLTKRQAQILSKEIFGKRTVDLVDEHHGGDWGAEWPLLRKIKIKSIGSGYYQVKGAVFWYDENDDSTVKMGRFKLILQEKIESSYGYVAKMFKIRKE